MTFRATTVFFAAMFASQVALTAVSFADGKKGKDGSTEIRFRADLDPVPLPDVDNIGDGKAHYKKKTGKKGTEEKFKGKVEFPILDIATADDAVFEMHLARLGVDYAVCLLRIKEIEFKYQPGNPVPVGIEAEYVVDVSQRTPLSGTPKLTEKVGSCTALDGTTHLVPAVQEMDTATVFQQGSPSTLLSGTFLANSDHDDHD